MLIVSNIIFVSFSRSFRSFTRSCCRLPCYGKCVIFSVFNICLLRLFGVIFGVFPFAFQIRSICCHFRVGGRTVYYSFVQKFSRYFYGNLRLISTHTHTHTSLTHLTHLVYRVFIRITIRLEHKGILRLLTASMCTAFRLNTFFLLFPPLSLTRSFDLTHTVFAFSSTSSILSFSHRDHFTLFRVRTIQFCNLS